MNHVCFYCFKFLEYLNNESMLVEVWGYQKDEGFKSGADKSKLTTKDLMSRERSNLGMGGGAATPTAANATKQSDTKPAAQGKVSSCRSSIALKKIKIALY